MVEPIKAAIKRYSVFSLVVGIVFVNIWLFINGESILPPDIYTQQVSVAYGIMFGMLVPTWFIYLYVKGETSKVKDLYNISIKDSILGMVVGTLIVLLIFWVGFSLIAGVGFKEFTTEQLIALIIFNGLIIASMETLFIRVFIDTAGYIMAAIFFSVMHFTVYGVGNIGAFIWALVLGYIWARLLDFKTPNWKYDIFGLGFVIATHATYNIMTIMYEQQILSVLSFGAVGFYVVIALLLIVIAIGVRRYWKTKEVARIVETSG